MVFEYEKKTYTATTSATGEFSIDVDVIDKGGNVELYFSDLLSFTVNC